MASHGVAIIANRALTLDRLATAQAGAATSFPTADLTIENPEPVEDLADALAANRPRDLAAGRTLTGPHRADLVATFAAKATPARLCSTGEQKALLISLVLANARALAEDFGAPPILLLDEVAAHLDADRRAALYGEINALGAQAFLTGTGAELFDSLPTTARLIEIRDREGQSHLTEIP